jgi:hypothetical protein
MKFATGRQRRSFFLVVSLGLLLAVASNLFEVVGAEEVASDRADYSATIATGADEQGQSSAKYGDFARFQSQVSSWIVTADALFLQRSAAQREGILFHNNGNELLSTSDLGFGMQAGPRLILLRQLDSGWILDLEYFGIDGWSATTNTGGGRLVFDRSQSIDFLTQSSILYASRFRTAEANLRAPRLGWLQPVAGFRWIGLNETYQPSGTFFGGGSSPTPFVLRYNTRNNLYGGQLGANAILWDRGGSLTITSLSKAGLYLGDSLNSGAYNSQLGNTATTIESNGHRLRAAFFGEVGVIANWQISDHSSIRCGYQLYWLNGVALAPNQPTSTDLVGATGGINSGGSTFMHGPSAGFQLSW